MPDTPILSSPIAPEQPTETVSVWSRMANVIAAPGEAFDGILAIEKKASLWLTPLLITIVLTIGFSSLMMNNPAMQQKMRQQMMQKFDEQIRDGKMTQDQAEKMADMSSGIAKYGGIFAGVIGVPFMVLVIAAGFYAILAFVLGGELTFMNVFVVVALAGVVGMIELIVGGCMQYATADFMAQPTLGYAISGVDNPFIKATLMRVNPFSLWWLYVVITGFSKICSVPKNKITVGVVSAWVVVSVIFIVWAGFMGGNMMVSSGK